jgi:hypothetical protein
MMEMPLQPPERAFLWAFSGIFPGKLKINISPNHLLYIAVYMKVYLIT